METIKRAAAEKAADVILKAEGHLATALAATEEKEVVERGFFLLDKMRERNPDIKFATAINKLAARLESWDDEDEEAFLETHA